MTAPAHGSLFCDLGAESCVCTPCPGFNGVDTFTYTITDPSGETSEATIVVFVDPV